MWKRWTRHCGFHGPTQTREARATSSVDESGLCEDQAALGIDYFRKKKAKKDEKSKSKKKRMTKKPSTTKTRTGNALAQFMILSGLTVVAYQFLVTRLYSSDGVTSEGDLELSKLDRHRVKYRSDREVVSTTEFSCFMACVGLFGLMQRKKKRSEEEEAAVEAQRRSVEKRVAKARDLAKKRSSSSSSKEDIVSPMSSPRGVSTSLKAQKEKDLVAMLASDMQLELLAFLSAEDLVTCTMVNKSWHEAVGDQSDILWRQVFQRDFGESGRRFAGIVPHICWRQYYFLHHLSRAVEIAQWLDSTQQRKCVVIEGHVYDVTGFLDSHPGGYHVIGDVLGTDASDLWDQFQHSAEAKELMKEFIVEDAVLNALAAPESKFLKRNLAVVDARWRKLTWWLAHAHLFGGLSRRFLDVGFKYVVWRTSKRPLRPVRALLSLPAGDE